ncbi:hypothetical protein PBI_ZOEJ_40 [Mycobacterium phage ZoeJ]|uniref:DUF4352 domain-containing protein n=1 Tax=Mycobacterium phage ZoeJ TaxID=1486427 RepID=A0A023W6A3_9CAUD|nr:queuine tRNA-ribosyltransferase [Mycobacterium phage ZoeJ]AHY26864.1 hypothetical protein PBI_ZOEJ_40 [Mycobacterium phage ZoeJ]
MKHKKAALAAGGVFAFIAFASCVGSHTDSTSSSSHSSATASHSASSTPSPGKGAAAPAGSAVRDGKFEFRVVGVERAKTVSDPTGNPYMTATAQGEFVVVTLSVENVGNEARSFSGVNQKLVDTAGRQYSAHSAADMYMNGGTGDINPGNAIQARVAFDVAPGTEATELILHDSMLSGGAHLALGSA